MVMKGLKRYRGIAAAACLLLLPSVANAQAMKLSANQAVDIALENNYSLKVAESRVDQADARYLQTRKAYLPTVTLSETFVGTNDPAAVFSYKLRQRIVSPADLGNQYLINNPEAISNFQVGIEVMQPLVNIDARKGRSAAAAARKSAEYQLDRAGDTVGFEVRKAYYGLVLATSNLKAVDRSIAAMQSHDREAGRAYAKGLITKSDKLSTGVRLAELREQRMMIQDEIRTASDALCFLLRLDGDTVIEPVDDLLSGGPGVVAGAEGVAEGRADLKALEAATEAAGYQYQMAKASSLPRLNAFGQTNWNDNSFPGLDEHNWTVGMTLSWTVFDGYGAIGKAQEAKAAELESRYRYEEGRDRSRYEVRQASRSLSTARSRIAIARQALEEAKVSLDYIGERYRSGMAMTFELLGRESAYTYAQMRLNKARYDYIIAGHELQYASGL
ncbi:outer membrane efflux protein [Prosthecochloris aestuarii DSM 271]|uniref:Outer membrane efflux protein n=2 Tax=Chlorobiaceae TaxID=191412 RepID=B4S3V3_PROA2|nr:outer membrane efflux protein [Prosthecochloris aestuarii DSM 271]